MDIFKLIFEHDQRLDTLRERHTDRATQDISSSIEDFLSPDPTYSKFYLTGTRLKENQFGLSTLNSFSGLLNELERIFSDYHTHSLKNVPSLNEAVTQFDIGEPIILSEKDQVLWNLEELTIDKNSNAGHKKEAIANLLKTDDLLLYKEQAHNGYDLHLFSKKNIYHELFYPMKSFLNNSFRFFSINGKRIRSERKFYFETWTLDRPPHGVEEVFPETTL
ncbi:MAG: hypothetical protein R6V27_15835 [Balneolaceae bacterium]